MVAPGQVALGVAIAVFGGWLGLRQTRRSWRRRQEIKSAESVATGSLRPGVVQLEGVAQQADETFTSPLTGQECLAYAYTVEERRRTNAGGSDSGRRWKWQTVEDVERAAPFYVDDGSGPAMVDAPVAEFAMERAYHVDSDDVATGAAGKLLATVTGGATTTDVPVTEERREEMHRANYRRRYEERLILPGESVYVYGEAVSPRELDVGAGGNAGLVGGVVGLLESGEKTSPVLSGAMSLFSGGTDEFRRTKRRGEDAQREAVSGTSGHPQERRAEMQEMAEQMQAFQGRDPESLTAEEQRQIQEMAESVQTPVQNFTETMNAVTSPGGAAGGAGAAGEGGGHGAGGGSNPFANERLVVSRGDSVADFVLSDREKSGVVRSYTGDVLKWFLAALGSLLAGGAVVAFGLGLVG